MGSSKSATLPNGPIKNKKRRLGFASKHQSGLKRHKPLSGEDCISKLPEEILVSILSLMTIKEAGSTSILSHRWEKLWISYRGVLDFEIPKSLFNARLSVWPQVRRRCIYSMNQALRALLLSGPSSMNAFIVRFDDWDKYPKSLIDKFVEFAMTKTFQRLEFDLSPRELISSVGKPYAFPNEFYEWIKQPCGLKRISYLTSLTLRNINVTGEFIEHILSSCPLIERLCVLGSKKLSKLKVSVLNLKYLEIQCYCLETLEVCAPNLMSLYAIGLKIKLHVGDSPKLVDATIGCDDMTSMLTSLSRYLSKLQTLFLNFSMKSGINKNFTQSVVLNQLKHLVLKITTKREESILGWTSLIEASPFLQKITLVGTAFPDDYGRKLRQIRKVTSKHGHEFLKVVEFIAFSGVATEMELAVYFLENATKLEKIVIDRRFPITRRCRFETEDDSDWKEKQERALQLEKHLPPGVEFVLI